MAIFETRLCDGAHLSWARRGEPGARERDVAKQSTFTNKNGATITRNVDFERDRDMHTWTKDVTAEHAKGE
jgi:hypothetical protein